METILLTIVIFTGIIVVTYIILYNNIQAFNIKINEAESIIDDLLRKKYDNLDNMKSIILKETDLPEQTFEMIRTPGHKDDLISFLFNKDLFCGDFIFKGTIGRYDLDGSNFKDMQNSIHKILKYDKDITIYPGHGNSTTLKEEEKQLKNYV